MTPRLTSAEYSGGYRISLSFEDGTVREIDLEQDPSGARCSNRSAIWKHFARFGLIGNSARSSGRTGLIWRRNSFMGRRASGARLPFAHSSSERDSTAAAYRSQGWARTRHSPRTRTQFRSCPPPKDRASSHRHRCIADSA
jgi:hypothetical protein